MKLTKPQKQEALNTAVEITKELIRAGTPKVNAPSILKKLYDTIAEIMADDKKEKG
ncbi:MAG: hypothetical protein NTY16_10920 [Deltaproteobacteria bacterium]|nr:hypothetical protein [Deltaproteobacteria bacterium]